MGLRIQLGHSREERCSYPQRAFADDFVIIDVHGVHDVALDYCGCERAESKHIQLLRARLFPATSVDPKTACTLRLMEFYHVLHNQTKASGFEFYTTLARRSNNTGTEEVKASKSCSRCAPYLLIRSPGSIRVFHTYGAHVGSLEDAQTVWAWP